MAKKIVVLGTGGTVAGRAASRADNIGYVAGQVAVADLLAGVAPPAGVEVECEQVAQIDSKDMDSQTWRRLALRCAHWLAEPEVTGIVVTHGTDTMEETAFFLQSLLAPAKPVVLTGAMRPATSLAADGPANIADALRVAAAPGARGVVVVFAGGVHGARDVLKQHPYRIDPFVSADAGCVGYVEEGVVRQVRAWPEGGLDVADAALRAMERATPWPRVEIVLNHAGADGRIVSALVGDGVQGIVAAGTGNGTLSAGLEAALLGAQASGVRVVRASRCEQGRVISHGRGPFPDSGGLTAVKARIELILKLLAAAA
ncbi:MAG TPA: asparaginase [Ramlibacter sp.]|uniref:asparaginase n=1 Tax=Ramlibacter sp. TaxID=1917967 RepID=UPI002B6DD0A6|nr:asparaginase [Ramlibacter sp.]HVZ46740.1 asparaginase [Ramlibacter sp.]